MEASSCLGSGDRVGSLCWRRDRGPSATGRNVSSSRGSRRRSTGLGIATCRGRVRLPRNRRRASPDQSASSRRTRAERGARTFGSKTECFVQRRSRLTEIGPGRSRSRCSTVTRRSAAVPQCERPAAGAAVTPRGAGGSPTAVTRLGRSGARRGRGDDALLASGDFPSRVCARSRRAGAAVTPRGAGGSPTVVTRLGWSGPRRDRRGDALPSLSISPVGFQRAFAAGTGGGVGARSRWMVSF